MIFTHKKKTYFATCLQWNGQNTTMVTHILERAGCMVSVYGEQLMLRWPDNSHGRMAVETMNETDWIRCGENDQIKIMKNAEFVMKYEVLK